MNGFLHATLLASLAIAIFSAAVFPVNVRTMPRLSRSGRPAPSAWPRVSIVVPARNEERGIEVAMRSQLAQDYPDFEVIAVDDRSTDETLSFLERLAREDPRLRVLSGAEPPAGWLGKPHALHQGAAAASGTILLFADADVLYDRRTVREAVALLEAEGLDFVALFPGFEMHGFWENVVMPYIPIAYFFGLGFLANSDRHPWIAAGGGAGNMVRRAAYESAGGHAAMRDSVIDDVRLAMAVKRGGSRCRIVRAEDRVRVRMYRGFREVFDGFTKNASFVFSGGFGFVFLAGTALTVTAALAPIAALLAAALGAPIAAGDIRLAACVVLWTLILRGALARLLSWPQWTTWTQPLMAAAWGAIILRSLYWRFVRREVLWRGRRYDAARARF
jgi:chlorobactene glucosyltransferase